MRYDVGYLRFRQAERDCGKDACGLKSQADILPENLELPLLDLRDSVVFAVINAQRDCQIPYIQEDYCYLCHFWGLDCQIQPSVTAIPGEPHWEHSKLLGARDKLK